MACGTNIIDVSTAATCTLTPKKASNPITALASAFSTSATGGTSGGLSPSIGSALTFTYTAGATSGPFSVSAGLASVAVIVVATPDSGSTLLRASGELAVNGSMVCSIGPKPPRPSLTV